jgi:hypothetical protein
MSITKRGGVLLQHLRDLSSLGVTMGIEDGAVVTLLSAVRPCGKGVPPKGPWICLEVRT